MDEAFQFSTISFSKTLPNSVVQCQDGGCQSLDRIFCFENMQKNKCSSRQNRTIDIYSCQLVQQQNKHLPMYLIILCPLSYMSIQKNLWDQKFSLITFKNLKHGFFGIRYPYPQPEALTTYDCMRPALRKGYLMPESGSQRPESFNKILK